MAETAVFGWLVAGRVARESAAAGRLAPDFPPGFVVSWVGRVVQLPGGALAAPLLAVSFLTSLTTYLSASFPIDFTRSSLVCLSVAESKVTFWV